METAEKVLNDLIMPQVKHGRCFLVLLYKEISNPVTLIQMFICDADHYHLSLEEYPRFAQQLRLEFQYILKEIFSRALKLIILTRSAL
ncbi:hypothetical protein AAKU52_003064 [Pedobacter sp. CG_S7]